MNARHTLSLATLTLTLFSSSMLAQGTGRGSTPTPLPPKPEPPKPTAPTVQPGSMKLVEVKGLGVVAQPGLQVGDHVEASLGTWTPADAKKTIQWTRCKTVGSCTPIPGATSDKYAIVAADEDNRLAFLVTATNAVGSTTVEGPISNPVTKRNEVPPSLAPGMALLVEYGRGKPTVGETARANHGMWDKQIDTKGEQIQWERCLNANPSTCQPISGATDWAYKLAPEDKGHGVRYVLTVSAKGVMGSANSKVLGPIEPAPTPVVPTKKP